MRNMPYPINIVSPFAWYISFWNDHIIFQPRCNHTSLSVPRPFDFINIVREYNTTMIYTSYILIVRELISLKNLCWIKVINYSNSKFILDRYQYIISNCLFIADIEDRGPKLDQLWFMNNWQEIGCWSVFSWVILGISPMQIV